MILDSTTDSLQCYSNRIFENYEALYKGKDQASIEICVTVATDYRDHKLSIKYVGVSDVEIWENDKDVLFVSDEMLLIIKNEITNKVKNLI